MPVDRPPDEEQLVFDSTHEFGERLQWYGALDDERVEALFKSLTYLALDTAELTQVARQETASIPPAIQSRIDGMSRQIQQIVELVSKWWNWEPFFPDEGPVRDFGPYPAEDFGPPLRDIRDGIAAWFSTTHGEQWDGRSDPGIPGVKWWSNDDGAVIDPENPKPMWALWFDGVEWRDYGDDDIPCGGLRCTVVEISVTEHHEWCEKLRAVMRGHPAE